MSNKYIQNTYTADIQIIAKVEGHRVDQPGNHFVVKAHIWNQGALESLTSSHR